MIIRTFHLELYNEVIEHERLFYHARNTLASPEDLTIYAKVFLSYLSSYEKIVPNKIRERLKPFGTTKNLASEVVRIAREKEVKL